MIPAPVSGPLAIALLAGMGCLVAASGLWALRARQLLGRARVDGERLAERRAQAERASRAKSRSVAGATHELRTPLTAVIGFTELVREGRAGPVTHRQQEYLGVVRASAGHLLELVDDVLDAASIEAGHMRLDPQPVAPDAVAGECVAALAHLAAERGVTLEYRPRDVGMALLDAARLRQVIVNFLSNAIKFTDAGGRATLSVTRRDGRLFVAVSDTGIGIADGDRSRIFDEFVRLGGRAGGRPGSGLGLALTRQIVHAQGGGVGVESRLGVGSTFTAWLPWVQAGFAPGHSESAWHEVVVGMGLGESVPPSAAAVAGRRRRFRPRRGVTAPAPADAASRSANAPAGHP